ncbi:MAG: hypothetical protein KGO01_19480, partial [Burkholderiales bacterium]|nr:hypothetical protein [Burkholderiales bacterium]
GPRWRDGAHWIDLAAVRRGAPLMPLVAKALGVTAGERGESPEDLYLTLERLEALVVLDNCEHLVDDVVAFLGPLLRRAGGLRWLATSQERLHLGEESVYRLGPLDLPDPEAGLEQALQSGALTLLCRRTRAADRQFELDAAGLATAIDICRQLDGLPLAIEMAAAHVPTLGLRGVHEQLDQRLRLRAGTRDAPARHHTLLQTYEWSYGLLAPIEQAVFRRLEPFLGGYTAQLAQQLCCAAAPDGTVLDRWQMLDALTALADRSLVQRGPASDSAGPDRLHLLESARDFARLRLDEAGETAAVHRRHAEVVADWFDTARRDLEQCRDDDWAAKYMPERRNVIAALNWATANRDAALAARLVAALAPIEDFGPASSELARLEIPLDLIEQAPPPLRAPACLGLAWTQFREGSRELATQLGLRALGDFEALGDITGCHETLTQLIRTYRGRPGMMPQAQACLERLQRIDAAALPLRARLAAEITISLQLLGDRSFEALQRLLRVVEHSGFDYLAAVCRVNITDALIVARRYEEAVETAQAMLAAGEQRPRVRGMICHNQALALVRLGRVDEARAAAAVMLRALPSAAHLILDIFAWAAARAGRDEDAALMMGRSQHIKRERNRHSDPAEAALIDETLARLQQTLGAERREEWMRLGAAMSTADMLKRALAP